MLAISGRQNDSSLHWQRHSFSNIRLAVLLAIFLPLNDSFALRIGIVGTAAYPRFVTLLFMEVFTRAIIAAGVTIGTLATSATGTSKGRANSGDKKD
jgi:predicted transcriptional regulator